MHRGIQRSAVWCAGVLLISFLTSTTRLAADVLLPVAVVASNDLVRLEQEPRPDRATQRQMAALRLALRSLASTNGTEWRLAAVTRRLPANLFPTYVDVFSSVSTEVSLTVHDDAASAITLIEQLPPRPGRGAARMRLRPLLAARAMEEASTDPWTRARRLLLCRQKLNAATNAAHRVIVPLAALPSGSLRVAIGWTEVWPNWGPEWNGPMTWDNEGWTVEISFKRTATNLMAEFRTDWSRYSLWGKFNLDPGAYHYALPPADEFIYTHPPHVMSQAFTVDFANAGSIYVFTNATHAFGVVAAGGECTVNGTFNAVIQQPPVVLPPWEDW